MFLVVHSYMAILQEKLRRVEELDDSDGDDNTLPIYHAQAPEIPAALKVRVRGQRN
jgi:hypothetical protein